MNPTSLTRVQLAAYIDHTLLKADATAKEIELLCTEACENHFFGVCVNGSWVRHARRLLADAEIKVISVVGFPLGAMSSEAKCFETEAVVNSGAQEIDLVLNIGRLKQGDNRYILRELSDVVKAADGRPVKVILETCLLSPEQKIRACRLAVESGARFVKTSTGFGVGGATVADIKLMRAAVGPAFGVKAAGGIRDAEAALSMIKAGANRLGTSASVAIIRSLADLKRNHE
jgi:deoxyribose-phosphate aldolase